MTRKAFLQKYWTRFAASLTLAALIVYTLYHVFWSTSGSLLTTPVRMISDPRSIGGVGWLFREESVLTSERAGLINDLSIGGEKIGKDLPLTEVWYGVEGEELAAKQTELDMLNRMISVLEDSLLPPHTALTRAELFRRSAFADYAMLRRAEITGDWSELRRLEDSMLTMLNRYTILTDPASSVETALQELRAARNSLLTGTPVTFTNNQQSGYFYDRTTVDGYESLFQPSALQTLTVDGFSKLIASPPAENGFAVGKMVYTYRWDIAIPITVAASLELCVGDTYTVQFPENGGRELQMQCGQLITAADGSRAIAVMTSTEVPSDFSYLRSQRVEIKLGDREGYYIPASALQVKDGVEGVYIFENSAVYFRRVEVLYRGDGYCIAAEQGERGDEYLALYDIMVTSGRDLYEGRVFQ